MSGFVLQNTGIIVSLLFLLFKRQIYCYFTSFGVQTYRRITLNLPLLENLMRAPWSLRFLKRKFPHVLWGEASEWHLETQRSERNGIEIFLCLTTSTFKVHQHFELLRISSNPCSLDVITEGRIKD